MMMMGPRCWFASATVCPAAATQLSRGSAAAHCCVMLLLSADCTHNKPKIHVGLYGEKLTRCLSSHIVIAARGIHNIAYSSVRWPMRPAQHWCILSNVFMSSSRRFIHEITVIRIPHPLMHSSIFSNLELPIAYLVCTGLLCPFRLAGPVCYGQQLHLWQWPAAMRVCAVGRQVSAMAL